MKDTEFDVAAEVERLSKETARVTNKMLEIARTPHATDLDFAKNFIEAQYQLINCLINEKTNLLIILNAMIVDKMITTEDDNSRTIH